MTQIFHYLCWIGTGARARWTVPGKSWLGCKWQRQHSGTRDRSHHLPILLILQKQDCRQRCCPSYKSRWDLLSSCEWARQWQALNSSSFPAPWGDGWLELEVLPGDLWQESALYPIACSQYSVSRASLGHSCSWATGEKLNLAISSS